MSAARDPFSLLRDLPEPQPDPVVMNAVIAQSAEAFSRREGAAAQGKSVRRANGFGWFSWLLPAACAALGLFAGVALAPLLGPGMQAPQSETAMAEAPADEVVRMGAQPGPRLGPPPAGSSMVTYFDGDAIRIGARFAANTLALFLPELGGDAVIDQQPMAPGEEIEILGAFRMTDPDRVAVRLRVNDLRFWRIYTPAAGSYARDTELSALVSSAEDEAAVRDMLGQN